ncbi:uncharacterized protein LOC135701671 [Ochlerotatus camptorhynchus]|uniref:uncharacterized protein LOC135701671 n=1 Tax=Ochlerotatus camptorhynchus TaxID=644619 RepID=UPI0031E31621
MMILVIYFYLFTTSTYYYRHDIEKILHNITTFGFSIQMSAKIYLFVICQKRITEIHELNLIFFEDNCSNSSNVKNALVKNAMLTNVVLKLTAMSTVMLCVILAFAPVLYSIITSDKLLPYGFEWVHSNTWTAYFINYPFQCITTSYVALATVSTDATFILYLLTGCGKVDTLIAMFQDLNVMIERNVSEHGTTEQLTKIIKLNQHLKWYMASVEKTFKGYFLVTLGCLSLNMIISATAVILINWFMGVVVVLFSTIQLFYVCFLGTFWQIKNDELLIEVWFFDWYKLSVKNQKSYLLFLNAAQAPATLTAIFIPLNMSAYLTIHKTLYSICMILSQFSE